jgi:hypothetical protein
MTDTKAAELVIKKLEGLSWVPESNHPAIIANVKDIVKAMQEIIDTTRRTHGRQLLLTHNAEQQNTHLRIGQQLNTLDQIVVRLS